jgi:hypothetical protein
MNEFDAGAAKPTTKKDTKYHEGIDLRGDSFVRLRVRRGGAFHSDEKLLSFECS